jgi:sigma-B regulation protein RsbU (phosphoserine phosphatase)
MQFGAERLMELVRNAPSGDVMTLIKIIVDGVATHVADHPASDDLTILLISYRPRDVRIDNSHGSRWILDIPAQREAIPLAQLRLQGILRARSVDATRIDDAALVVEELVANVIASAEQSGHVPHIALEVEISPEEVLLNLSDDCSAFDPLQLEEPQLDAEIAERPIGGLGVFLVRQLADTCRYERVNGRNNFEVRLRRSQSPLPIAYSRIGS